MFFSSKEMFVFISSAVGLLVIAILGFFSNGLLNSWSALFVFAHPEELLSVKIHNSWISFRIILYGAAIFGIPCLIGVLLIQSIVGNGLSISSKALSFKWTKLDPIKGLGRIVSVKGLVELVKSIAKVGLLTGLVVGFVVFITKYDLSER